MYSTSSSSACTESSRLAAARFVGRLTIILAGVALGSAHALAQAPPGDSLSVHSSQAPSPWRFSLSVEGFLPAEGQALVNPSLAADHGWLHLETRYNYEAAQTGSAWIGYNFATGRTLAFQATPMAGGVFGNVTGAAVGLEFVLSYKKFELASEQEYVYGARNSSESFFYAWPELTYSPLTWFGFGLVAQKTRAYKSSLEVQRGFLVQFSYQMLQFSTSVLNIGWTAPTWILSLGVSF